MTTQSRDERPAIITRDLIPESNGVEALASDWREACDYLDHYAGYIRSVHSSELERHPYLPALERVAGSMRLALSPPAISKAVEAEREACAMVAESFHRTPGWHGMFCKDIASAIRTRTSISEVVG